jgi:hypothetical protein
MSAACLHASGRNGEAQGALSLVLWAFLITCVFDPADKLLGMKVWIFLLCWLFAACTMAARRRRIAVPAGLFAYTSVFILVPLLSIAWYVMNDGREPFEGLGMFKGYVLITLALLLVLSQVNLLRELSAVLTLLAIAVIAVFVGLMVSSDFYAALYLFGKATGIVLVDKRDYGSGVILLQVYFVTSPMLAISIAYYFDRVMSASVRKTKILYFILMLLSIVGMLLAGSRNNILVSMLLPIALWFLYTRHKVLGACLSLVALTGLFIFFFDELQAFFDPTEISNSVKLGMYDDYSKLFSDPITLLFGQGLGAYHFWEGRGTYYYVTELTYFEMVRNFGLFGAAVMLALLLFPIIHAFVLNRRFPEKAVVIGYAAYLVMSFSNPNLFSSMGTLILSVILATIYLSPIMNKNRCTGSRG